MVPLYEKIKMLSLCGGEITIYKYGLELGELINKKYKNITIVTESNGINFNEHWQKLAVEGLWSTNFSINGSSWEIYRKACWKDDCAKTAYEKAQKNIKNYITKLKEKNWECFAPSVSMVINKDSASDVYNFCKYALEIGARKINYYFDHRENRLGGVRKVPYFANPDISRPALRTLMEMERVLARKFNIYFRLYLPELEAPPLQAEVDAMPINKLREKYKELLELAKGRDMLKEHNERNRIRREAGKKELSFDESFNATLRLTKLNNKDVCFTPWSLVDINAAGKLSLCSWARSSTKFDLIRNKNGRVDWGKTLNSKAYITYRKQHYNGDFTGCQQNCPMNAESGEIVPFHKYGFLREEE